MFLLFLNLKIKTCFLGKTQLWKRKKFNGRPKLLMYYTLLDIEPVFSIMEFNCTEYKHVLYH